MRLSKIDQISYNKPVRDLCLVACPQCDLLQHLSYDILTGRSVCCYRCNKELWRHRKDSFNRTLALTIATLILYIIANSGPILGLTAVGHEASTTIIGGAEKLWNNNQQIVAALVLFVAVIAPALQIGFQLFILLGCFRKRPKPWVGVLLRYLNFTRTWSMLEVMLLGVLVALTKISDYATVITSVSFFSLFAVVFLLAAMQSSFDPHEVWRRIIWAEEVDSFAGNKYSVEDCK